jgi:hypothetical protein
MLSWQTFKLNKNKKKNDYLRFELERGLHENFLKFKKQKETYRGNLVG